MGKAGRWQREEEEGTATESLVSEDAARQGCPPGSDVMGTLISRLRAVPSSMPGDGGELELLQATL